MDINNINRDRDTSGLGPIEYDQSKVPQLSRKYSSDIRSKTYGKDVRESIARGVEYAGLIASESVGISNENKSRQDKVESQFNSVQQELTDKDPISAPEIIAARGGEPTLNDRLDKEQQKIYWIDPVVDFGAIGDGVADDTEALQEAFNHASAIKVPVIGNGDDKFKINKPLYLKNYVKVDFNGAELVKTTNTKGTGSTTYGAHTITHDVDAHIIVANTNGTAVHYANVRNINFRSTAPNKHLAGVWGVAVNKSRFANLHHEWGKFDYGVAFHNMWLIYELDNVRVDEGLAAWKIFPTIGMSTSIKAGHLTVSESENAVDLFGVAYSVIDTPLSDNSSTSGSVIKTQSCEGVTINSPSAEYLNNGSFLHAEDSNLVINAPRVMGLRNTTTNKYLFNIREKSRVVVNGGNIVDYDTTTILMNPVIVQGDSKIIFNNTRLPLNGNNYTAQTSKDQVVYLDRMNSKMDDFSGSGTPEGNTYASAGAIYRDTSTGQIYTKTTSASYNTGWKPLVINTRMDSEGGGSPEGKVYADTGAIYRDKTNGDIYVKTTNNGVWTGWKKLAFV